MAGKASAKGRCRAEKWMMGAETRQSHGHKGQRIVEENLYRMQDKGVLQEIYHPVKEPRQHAHAGSEAVGNQQQRHHGASGYAAPLGHVKETELLQDDC